MTIADSDLEVTTGCDAAHPDQRGGQHVAKKCTAVRIRHLPTGIEVVSKDERSQHGNRVKAMEMLRKALGIDIEMIANGEREMAEQKASWSLNDAEKTARNVVAVQEQFGAQFPSDREDRRGCGVRAALGRSGMSECVLQPVGDPPFVTCKRCDGRGHVYVGHDPDYCDDCGGIGEVALDMTDLITLAHNLAVAGGLCASFALGKHYTWHAMYFDMPEPAEWSPGCQRSAP